ncbi:Phosphofurin acidic cluster sorting protein 1 [Trichinella zimbabwensis]|uniref:Phosphofurin acidic cluster sorting protein 1 n=1 Tax=Trichinella zimbabwensis TaxID=268475 RepID=A0A0V1HVX0_9BILA|nr:Phosphofurin acidic cluster sorting protein 1 [Trichinella zimbabwensis]
MNFFFCSGSLAILQFTNMEKGRVVPMRLFATWEIDRACSSSVPRLCCIVLNRLTILRPFEQELSYLVIAGFKRTLRSNDVAVLPVNGIVDVDLDISFTLQYPHFVKKQSNRLIVMLQRRKKYKNRPMLGYKTLAAGAINLTDILQNAVVRELTLYSDDPNCASKPAGKLYILSLSSQPLDQDDSKAKDQSGGDLSDDEEEDWTGNEEGGASDSEPIVDDPSVGNLSRLKNSPRFGGQQQQQQQQQQQMPVRFALHQKNLKQKFIALLKKFKIPEEESSGVDFGKKPAQQELEALFEELESLTDSGAEQENDTVSLRSTPKPSLRPYFPSREALPTLRDIGSDDSKDSVENVFTGNGATDSEMFDVGQFASASADAEQKKQISSSLYQSEIFDGRKLSSARSIKSGSESSELRLKPVLHQNSAPLFDSPKLLRSVTASSSSAVLTSAASKQRQATASASAVNIPSILEQIQCVFPADDESLPNSLFLISSTEIFHCSAVVLALQKHNMIHFVVRSKKDVKTLFFTLVNKIQRFSNKNASNPRMIQLCLIGADHFFSYCLEFYTEYFGQKPNDWLNYIRFYPVACQYCVLWRYLVTTDRTYCSLFGDGFWREVWEKGNLSENDVHEVVRRLQLYLSSAKLMLPLTISEAMIHLKSENASSAFTQIFVPFVVNVRLASAEPLSAAVNSGDLPDLPSSSSGFSSAQVISNNSSSLAGQASSVQNISTNLITARAADVSSSAGHSSPPGSPHTEPLVDRLSNLITNSGSSDAKELQIEYWAPPNVHSVPGPSSLVGSSGLKQTEGVATKKDSQCFATSTLAKYSLKTTFRSLTISKSPSDPLVCVIEPFISSPHTLSLQFVKEKRKDKMLQKLGMKNKDRAEVEQKSQSVDGISRLICSSRQNSRMNLFIDGVEWSDVKFFQISALWQTHVKYFPVGIFQAESSKELN